MFAASKSGKVVAAATTELFAPTVLQLPGNGTNGAQNSTFIDSSSNAYTITPVGTITQGAFTPFSQTGWSGYFSGATDRLGVANPAFAPAGDFTIECWVNFSSLPANAALIGNYALDAATDWYIDTSTTTLRVFTNGANGGVPRISGGTLVDGIWYHVAVVRAGTTITAYLDGVSIGTYTQSGTFGSATKTIYLGSLQASEYLPGFLSNVRLVSGTAVYTGNFTPPTTPLTAVSGTTLLTLQGNRFKDNSSNNFTLTPTGTPKIQAFSPFEPISAYSTTTQGGGAYFPVRTDALTIPSVAAVSTMTGDFTIECWVYPTDISLSAGWGIIDARTNGQTATAWYFRVESYAAGTGWLVRFYNGVNISGTLRVLPFTWSHVAVVRSGTTIKFFVNGVLDGTTGTISGTITGGTSTVLLGSKDTGAGATYGTVGYISNFRMVNGTAIYSTTFTPPTAPVTAVTNTVWLVNGANAGIYDATAKSPVSTIGNAQVSTAQQKYGTGSIAFDGTGDWLTVPDSPTLQLQDSDFTIEGWVYLTALGVARGLVSKGTATTGWSVGISASNFLTFSYSITLVTGAGATVPLNTWTFFTVVRSGSATGNVKLYLNGVLVATSASAINVVFNQTNPMYVGADRTGTTPMLGYMDDVRVSKVARYTTAFTPPTQAFPIQ